MGCHLPVTASVLLISPRRATVVGVAVGYVLTDGCIDRSNNRRLAVVVFEGESGVPCGQILSVLSQLWLESFQQHQAG